MAINNDNVGCVLPYNSISDFEIELEFQTSKKRILSLMEDNRFKDFIHENNLTTILNPKPALSCNYFDEDEFNKTLKIDQNSLNIISFNIRSLPKHSGELVNFLSLLNTEFQVIVLTEIGARNISVVEHLFHQYQFYHVIPKTNLYGGVGIYVSNTVQNVTVLDNFSLTKYCECCKCSFESLFINFTYKNKDYSLGGIYRHPGGSIGHFSHCLEEAVNKLDMGRTCILAGDINIDLINYDHNEVLSYTTMLLSHRFVPYITLPTRITSHSATCIDHIFVRKNNIKLPEDDKSGIFFCDISDHLPCFVSLNYDSRKYNKMRPFIRIYSKKNCNKFLDEMSSTNWDSLFTRTENDWYQNFIVRLKCKFNQSFPLVKLSRKRSHDKPWITQAIKVSIKHNHRLYKNTIVKSCQSSMLVYKRYNAKLKKCIQLAQNKYYNVLFTNSKNANLNVWKVLGNVINPGKKKSTQDIRKILLNDNIIHDNVQISNAFNNHFCTVGKRLQEKFKNSNTNCDNYKNYLPPSPIDSFFLAPVSENDILNEIKKLNLRKACGPDDIPIKLLKLCPELFSKILVKIFNKSITDSVYPHQLKLAKVIALYKKGDRFLTDNYRPISLLSCFNKIFEKLIAKQLITYLESKRLLYEFQFGFRKYYSTSLALIETIDNIKQSIDEGNYELGIFIDLTKAFDTVDHNILLYKLSHYGIRGDTNLFLRSYLCNRKQYTFINGTNSEVNEINCGVPQGSVLGPLLFLIYINDMYRALSAGRVRLFADDTCIFIRDKNFPNLINDARERLLEVLHWCNDNKLIINSNKTSFVVFRGKYTRPYSNIQRIVTNDMIIQRAPHAKYLGITFDECLTWKTHIDSLCKSLCKYFGIFNHIKRNLTRNTVRQVYFACIYSRISYGIEILTNCSFTLLKKLQVMQSKLLKLLLNLNYRTPTDILHKNVHILKVSDVRTVKIIRFVQNCLLGNCPNYFQHYFVHREHVYNLRNDFLHINRTRTELGSSNIKSYGATLWNNLSPEVKQFCNQKNFVTHVIKYIMSRYGHNEQV